MRVRFAVLTAFALMAAGCGKSGSERLTPPAFPLAVKMKDALASVNASDVAGVVMIAESQMKTRMITESDHDILRRISETALGSEWNEARNMLDRALGSTGAGPKVSRLTPAAVDLGKKMKDAIIARELPSTEKIVATADQFLKVGQITATDGDTFKAVAEVAKATRWNEAAVMIEEALGNPIGGKQGELGPSEIPNRQGAGAVGS